MTNFAEATDVLAYANDSSYVRARNTTVATAIQLSGGMVNYVWRLTLTDASTVILKHFPPSLRVNPAFAFPQERCELEYIALRAATSQFPQAKWSAPIPYSLDAANYVILEQDMPGVSLFDLLKQEVDQPLSTSDFEWIASSLLTFLTDVKSLVVSDMSIYANSPLTPVMNRMYLRNLTRMIDFDIPHPQDWLDRAAACDLVATDSFLFGDFWPSSILVDVSHKRVAIIDWELARTGHFGLDLTQMMANLALMGRGQGYNNAAANNMATAIVAAWKRATSGADTFDFEAAYVKRVVQLSQYSHWGLDNVQAAVQDLVAAAPNVFAAT
ncbi:hypothetical protein H257_10672 [Aphanomyces astaci]|uniref:Aminoglycoside phosphotransferase domain-containing protein n=1 Tax=Aphanomyces astaci TaxID=112090 RepID=W4G823_APHAT|nr:hypothetical protein H257_10672 [Aphanomyces astaci]ETV75073.1 hypothetical protein H257_10672 [Aphanomyces astaci]|eukprot:XP_009835577.1 hypothetical protein H257_10672 [Aphanomyces astaci]